MIDEAIELLEDANRWAKGEQKRRIEFALAKVKLIRAKFEKAYRSELWEDWKAYIAEMEGKK